MKLKITILMMILSLHFANLYSQDEEKPGLNIAGSVDTYYKYDLSGIYQIRTSFADAQNAIGIGMVDISLSQAIGKASFVGELAFGPRANQSAPGPVQNLYISYQFSDLLKITGGFIGTFVGYEVISPVPNFNYSTSYLFSYGPFQNAGVKADFHFSDHVAFMIGAFNRFDSYTNDGNSLSLGSQLSLIPVDGFNIYLNFVSSDFSGTELDLTTSFQATESLKLGLNVAKRTTGPYFDDAPVSELPFRLPFMGAAVYLNYQISDPVALGIRFEHFIDQDGIIYGNGSEVNLDAITLSGNIKAGPIRLIPEFRFDMGSQDIFTDSGNAPVGSASQVLLAAVYAF